MFVDKFVKEQNGEKTSEQLAKGVFSFTALPEGDPLAKHSWWVSSFGKQNAKTKNLKWLVDYFYEKQNLHDDDDDDDDDDDGKNHKGQCKKIVGVSGILLWH